VLVLACVGGAPGPEFLSHVFGDAKTPSEALQHATQMAHAYANEAVGRVSTGQPPPFPVAFAAQQHMHRPAGRGAASAAGGSRGGGGGRGGAQNNRGGGGRGGGGGRSDAGRGNAWARGAGRGGGRGANSGSAKAPKKDAATKRAEELEEELERAMRNDNIKALETVLKKNPPLKDHARLVQAARYCAPLIRLL
jgi:hypothetical protein